MDDLSFLDKYAQPTKPVTDYDGFIEESASRHNVDPDLIRAVTTQESSWKPKARSNKGASGLMQLMPATARNLGVKNIYDPKENIEGGTKYLRQLLDMFGGDVNLALAGYNAGEGAVQKYGNKIPPYKETQNYVKKITSNYKGNGYRPQLDFLDKYVDAPVDAPVEAPVAEVENGLSFLDKYVGDPPPATDTPTDVTSPVPESPDTLQAQILSTFDANSPKSMTLLTKDNPANNFILSMSEARRLTRVDTPNGIVLVNAKKLGIKPSEAKDYVKKNGFAKDSGFVIDMGNNTGDGQPAVAAVDPNTGKEVFAAVTPTPESAQAQAQQNQAMFPGTVQVPTNTDEVAAKRLDEGVAPRADKPRTQADINAEFERWIVANRLPRDNESIAKFHAIKQAEVDDENAKIRAENNAINVGNNVNDLVTIGEAAKDGKRASDVFARQAEIQKRFETEKAVNPALTVEQFKATLAAENAATNAKSKADWLAKNPKYAQFATAKQLDPHDPKTIEAYNAQLPKGGTRTVAQPKVAQIGTSAKSTKPVATTDAEYQAHVDDAAKYGTPVLTREQFNATANTAGSSSVSLNPNDFDVNGEKVTDLQSLDDNGGYIPQKEVGKQTDNLNGIAYVLQGDDKLSGEQAARKAYNAAAKAHGVIADFDQYLKANGGKLTFSNDYQPGNSVQIDYQALKDGGADIDALLGEQKAQKRVEQPSNIMPFVGQYTPQKQVTMPDGRIAYEDGDTIRKGLPGTEDGIAPTVFQQIQGLTDDEVKGQNTAWKYKFDSLYRQAVNTVAEVGGSKKDIDAEYARLMANEDMERDAALKYGKEQGERYGPASSGFVGSGGESVAYPAAIMRALNTLVPSLNDIGGRKLQNWLTNSSLAMAQAQATESEKNPDNVSSIIRMGAGAPGFISRLGVSTMLPGGAQLTFAKDAAIKSFGQGNDAGQVFKDTGVGLATDLLFKGGSALGDAVKKGALKKLLTKEAIEVVENGGLDFAYKGTDAAKKAFINAARRSLVADSAGMVTRLGVIGGGTYAMATAEGSKTPGKDTAMMLLFDLAMHAKKIGKMAKLSTQVWRVPGEKPDTPPRDVMLLTEGGDKIAVYDVTGKYPPEAIEGVISRVPGADADRSAFESRPMGGQTVVPLPEKNPVKAETKGFIPKIEPDDITESEKSPKIDLSVEKSPKDSLGDDAQKAVDKENARIAQGQLDELRKRKEGKSDEPTEKPIAISPVRERAKAKAAEKFGVKGEVVETVEPAVNEKPPIRQTGSAETFVSANATGKPQSQDISTTPQVQVPNGIRGDMTLHEVHQWATDNKVKPGDALTRWRTAQRANTTKTMPAIETKATTTELTTQTLNGPKKIRVVETVTPAGNTVFVRTHTTSNGEQIETYNADGVLLESGGVNNVGRDIILKNTDARLARQQAQPKAEAVTLEAISKELAEYPSADKAFKAFKNRHDIPADVAQAFYDKYSDGGKLSQRESFDAFYNDTKAEAVKEPTREEAKAAYNQMVADDIARQQPTRIAETAKTKADAIAEFDYTEPQTISDDEVIALKGKDLERYNARQRKLNEIGRRKLVKQAIADGKTVPQEVLADYPDLQARADRAAKLAARRTERATNLEAAKAKVAKRVADRKEAVEARRDGKPYKPRYDREMTQKLVESGTARIAELEADLKKYDPTSPAGRNRIAVIEKDIVIAKRDLAGATKDLRYYETAKTVDDVTTLPESQQVSVTADPSVKETKTSVKIEKVNPRTGLTETQTEYLAKELRDAAYKALELEDVDAFVKEFGKDGLHFRNGGYGNALEMPDYIKVPGDGKFKLTDVGAANKLHQKITGQPIPGLAKSKGAIISRTFDFERETKTPSLGKPSKEVMAQMEIEQEALARQQAKGWAGDQTGDYDTYGVKPEVWREYQKQAREATDIQLLDQGEKDGSGENWRARQAAIVQELEDRGIEKQLEQRIEKRDAQREKERDEYRLSYLKNQASTGDATDAMRDREIAKLEAKLKDSALRSIPETDYRDEHQAPGPDDAPLHDVTKGGEIYPEDFYSNSGLRYYGTGDEKADRESYAVIQRVRNRPNAQVRIYRAVPYTASTAERIAKLEEQQRKYFRRNKMPDDSTFDSGSLWFNWASDEIKRLQSQPAEDAKSAPPINSGDWVTLSRTYAKDHGENRLGSTGHYKIISKVVPARTLFTNGDSLNEFGYWDESNAPLRSIPETDPLQGIITDRGIDYERATNVAREVLSGKQEIRRLSPEGERGRIAGGERNVIATLILAGNERASEEAGSRTHPVKRQERVLEEYAKREGIWLDPKEFNTERNGFISKGVEAYVHRSDDGNTVTKLMDYKMIDRHATPLDFIDNRISAFNYLFPETKYELVGFTRDSKGDFRFVVKQRLIRDAVYSTPVERQNLMRDKGLEMTDKYGEAFANDLYKVSDLHEKNALRGADGTIYVIDAVPKAKQVQPFTVVRPDEALRSVVDIPQSQIDAVKEVRNADGKLLAPNSKVSNLNERQWKEVRTPNFIAWFGDWINDPENASQVVDSNGEPLAVYHGTTKSFDAFDPRRRGQMTEAPSAKQAFFFTKEPVNAEGYTELGSGRTVDALKAKYEQLEKVAQRSGKASDWDAHDRAYEAYESAEMAATNKDTAGVNEGANVLPIYLSLQNPLIHDFRGSEYREETYNDLIDRAKEEGRDGVIFKNTYDPGSYEQVQTDIYGAFQPTQIKSAIGNNGNFDPSDPSILRSVADTPFYSRVESVIRDKMPPRATSAQVTALLAKNSVKELDPEFQALKVYLDDQGSVSKDDVLAFVAANKTAVSEVVKGGGRDGAEIAEAWWNDEGGANEEKPWEDLTASERLDAYERYNEEVGNYEEDSVKFAQWQLPGESENYREEFLTAPSNKVVERLASKYGIPLEMEGALIQLENTVTDAEWNEWKQPENATVSENWKDGHADYSDIKNPIARIRYNDRTTTDGDKMLFGEEIQQPGKGNFEKMPKVYQKYGEQMAIRKMLYRAVEGGYDYFGFTTGQQQADRYDLSKHVKQIRTKAWSGGNRKVEIVPIKGDDIEIEVTPDGKVVEGYKEFIGKNLDEVVGKDLAPQILEAPTDGYKVFSGLDLKVGGEGLINRYDRKHVDYINKLMKPYGVQIESKEIRDKAPDYKIVKDGSFYTIDGLEGRQFNSEQKAQDWIDEYGKFTANPHTIHAVKISPEFRKAVEASIREHGGAFPLFKVAEPNDIADIEALGKGDFKELFNDIKSDVKSDATGANILDLGTNKTIELVRTAFAYMYDTPLEGTAIPGGMYLDPSQTNDFRDALQGIADAASEAGIESKGVDTLIKNLDKAAKDGDVRVIGFDNTLPHETIHQQSRRGAIDKELSQRYSDDGLGDDPVFNKFHKKLVEIQGKASLAVAREEALAYLSSGDYARFGLTEAEAIEIVAKLIESYAAKNGVESLKTFDGTQAYEAVENYYRKIESRETSNDSRSGVSGERETRPSATQAERAENDTGERGETFTPGGREKLSKTPSTLRKGGIPVQERLYTSTTDAERQSFANERMDDGLDAAMKWTRDQLDTKNNNAGATGVVGVNVMVQLGKEGRIAELNKFADDLLPAYTDSAQMIQSLAVVSMFSPDTAGAYVTKVAKQNGQDVTPEQVEKALEIAKRMSEVVQTDGITQHALDEAKAESERLTKDIADLTEALGLANDKNKQFKGKLSGQGRTIAALRRQIEGESKSSTRLPGAVKKHVKEITERKDDILERLKQKYGGNPILRMVAWHGSPHTFDKFDISKIGTGEGAQAYGHGLYFAGSEEIADWYKNTLSQTLVDGQPIKTWLYDNDADFADSDFLAKEVIEEMRLGVSQQSAIDEALSQLESELENEAYDEDTGAYLDASAYDIRRQMRLLKKLRKTAIVTQQGAKYKVNLQPQETEYLLWDVPLSEQTAETATRLRDGLESEVEDETESAEIAEQILDASDAKGGDIYQMLVKHFGSKATASEFLKSLGIRGIKYLDGTSRGKGEGSYNYVIFDDADVEIQEVLRQVAEKPAELDQDAVDAATIHLSKNLGKQTPAQVKDAINVLTNGQLTKQQIDDVYAAAVSALRIERTAMDADTKVANKLRQGHYREADKINDAKLTEWEKKLSKPDTKFVNTTVREGVESGYTDEAIWFALARKHHLNVNDALKALREEFPDADRTNIIRDSERLTQAVKNRITADIAQRQNQFTLNDEDIALIKEERRVNTHEKQKVVREANRFYSGMVKGAGEIILDTIVNFRRANLLTAVKTHFVNIGGNVGFAMGEEIARAPSTVVDLAASIFTGERTTTLSAKAIGNGLKALVNQDDTLKNSKWDTPEGKERGITAAKHVLQYGGSIADMERLQHSESILSAKFENRAARWVDNYINGVFKTLGAEDAFFKVYAFRRHIEEQARAIAITERRQDKSINLKERIKELVTNPTNVMQVQADRYAHFMTFQNDNALSGFIASIKRGRPGLKAGVETIMPYDRTPTNIVMRVMEYTPAGMVIAPIRWKGAQRSFDRNKPSGLKFRNELTGAVRADLAQSEDFNNLPETERRKIVEATLQKVFTREQQETFAKTIGRSSLGTGLFSLGFVMAAAGLMAGAMSFDDDDKTESTEAEKRKKAGIENGSIQTPWGRIVLPKSPPTAIMTAGATFYEQMALSKKSPLIAAVDAGVEAFGDMAKEVPLINSTYSVLRSLGKGKFGEFTGNIASGFVPASAMLRSLSDLTDDKERTGSGYRKGEKIKSPEQYLNYQGRGLRNTFIKGIPWLRQYADESTSGVSDIERGGIGRRIVRIIDPFNTRTEAPPQPGTVKEMIDGVVTYAKAIGTDPITAFKIIYKGERIRRVDNGAIIVERMDLEDSKKVKKDRNAQKDERLDHAMPLQLGGLNDDGNLELRPENEWARFTPIENALGRALRSEKITKEEAQKLMRQYKDGEITESDITSFKNGAVTITPGDKKPRTDLDPKNPIGNQSAVQKLKELGSVDNLMQNNSVRYWSTDDWVAVMGTDLSGADRQRAGDALRKKADNAQKSKSLTPEELERVKSVLPDYTPKTPKARKFTDRVGGNLGDRITDFALIPPENESLYTPRLTKPPTKWTNARQSENVIDQRGGSPLDNFNRAMMEDDITAVAPVIEAFKKSRPTTAERAEAKKVIRDQINETRYVLKNRSGDRKQTIQVLRTLMQYQRQLP